MRQNQIRKAFALVLVLMCASTHCNALTKSNVLFSASYDGSYDADYARGDGKLLGGAQAELVDGRTGKGVLFGNPGSELKYQADGNMDPKSGSVAMWIKPIGWSVDTYMRFFFRMHGVNPRGKSDNTDFAWLYKYFMYSARWITMQKNPYHAHYCVSTASGDTGGLLKFDWKSNEWGHLLASWSENQMVMYVNGEFAGSMYVDSSSRVRQPVKEFIIGGTGQNNKADTVLDDVLILDRPVTPEEAKAIYEQGSAALESGDKAEPKPLYNIFSRHDQSDNKVVLTSEIIGLRSAELKPFSIYYNISSSDGSKAISSGTVPATQLRQFIKTDGKGMHLGNYKVTAELRKSGNTVATAESQFETFPRPEWLGNKLGVVKTPPSPWTAIKRSGNTLACWGRVYSWENGAFPTSIKSQGKEILNRPVNLYAVVDGKRCSLKNTAFKWTSTSPVRANFTANGKLGNIPVAVQGYVEYDGFSWYKVKLGDQKTVGRKIDSLTLDLPIRAEIATLVHSSDSTAVESGKIYPFSTMFTLHPDVWIGNENIGLQWCTDSYSDLKLNDENNLASLSIGEDEVVYRVTMVDHTVAIDKPLSYTVGIEATPVKPVVKESREWEMAISTYKCDPPIMDKTWYGYWSAWNKIGDQRDGPYGYLVASDNTFKELKSYNAMGVTPLIYWNIAWLWTGDPVLRTFGNWGRYEENAYPYSAIYIDLTDPALRDYQVWRSWKLLNDNPELRRGSPGYYLDSTPPRWTNGIYTVLGTRDLQKRSYLAVKGSWPEIKYVNHESGSPNMSQLAFSDLVVTGEHLAMAADMTTSLNYYKVLSFDNMRADLLGGKFGIRQIFLPEIARSVHDEKDKYVKIYGPEGIPAAEHVIGMLWVHDLSAYRAYMNWTPIDQSNRAKKAFGWDRNTEFIGYWENGDLVRLSPDQSSVVVSVFQRSGKLLFVIMNNSDSDATVSMRPDWAKLGIDVPTSLIDAYREQAIILPDSASTMTFGDLKIDLRSGEPLPEPASLVTPVSNGSVTFAVKARNFKALVAR